MSHVRDGQWHSDRHSTPPNLLGIDLLDPRFQDLAYEYAERWRDEDPAFTEELQAFLRENGYTRRRANKVVTRSTLAECRTEDERTAFWNAYANARGG